MAELRFEAPLAAFDGDDWNDFNEHQCNNQDIANSNIERDVSSGKSSDADNFTETFSGSLEDLVNTFDDKIRTCFKDYGKETAKIAPVQVRSQEEIMKDCQSVAFYST